MQIRLDVRRVKHRRPGRRHEFAVVYQRQAGVALQPVWRLPVGDEVDLPMIRKKLFKRAQVKAQLAVVPVAAGRIAKRRQRIGVLPDPGGVSRFPLGAPDRISAIDPEVNDVDRWRWCCDAGHELCGGFSAGLKETGDGWGTAAGRGFRFRSWSGGLVQDFAQGLGSWWGALNGAILSPWGQKRQARPESPRCNAELFRGLAYRGAQSEKDANSGQKPLFLSLLAL